MKQRTLRRDCSYSGKGLHTGVTSCMTLKSAPCGSGIVFVRTDLGVEIPALAEYVGRTDRSTTISKGEASVGTIEHVLSALTGLGVDNCIIEIDNIEVPILDGSASGYTGDICRDGLLEQEEDRKYISIDREIEIKDEETGSWVKITPSDSLSYDITVDFASRVLGIQTSHWDESVDYAVQIGPCRTFCFFHELEYLASQGLVKGGDVDNAIVVVEKEPSAESLEKLSRLFGVSVLGVGKDGYLDNIELHFSNECGRHKMLDLIGDMRLAGGYLLANISAYKPGHTINTNAAKALRELLK